MNEQTDFKHLLRIVRRRWAWLVIVPIICSAVAFTLSSRDAKVYQASAEIRIDENDIATDVALITSQEVNSEARSRLGDSAVEVLSVDTSTIGDTQLARITARATTPETAAEAANVWAEAFADFRNDGETADLRTELDGLLSAADLLLPELISIDDQITVLEAVEEPTDEQRAELADLRSRESLLLAQQRDLVDRATAIQTRLITAPVVVSTTNSANVPNNPAEPKPVRQALFGLFAGLFLGALAAALAEFFDDRVWEPRDLVAATGGLPVLASVPPVGRHGGDRSLPVSAGAPQSAASEAFGMLGRTIRHVEDLESYPVIMTTSAAPDEGSSDVAANLAVVLARQGARVLLLEMDYRTKRDRPFFDIDRSTGLSDAIADDREANEYVVPTTISVGSGSLAVLPSGSAPDDPSEFASSPELEKQLQALRSEYDRIVIDAGPLLVGTEAVSTADYADAVCVVVRFQTSRSSDIERGLNRLDQVRTLKLGVVICDAPEELFFAGSGGRTVESFDAPVGA